MFHGDIIYKFYASCCAVDLFYSANDPRPKTQSGSIITHIQLYLYYVVICSASLFQFIVLLYSNNTILCYKMDNNYPKYYVTVNIERKFAEKFTADLIIHDFTT